MAEYEFCVDRKSNTQFDRIHVIFTTGDFDPGREVVRLYVAAKYKENDTTALTVSDYEVGTCDANVEDKTGVTGTDQDWKVISDRLAAGDPVGALVGAAGTIFGVGAAAAAGVMDAGGGAAKEAAKAANDVAKEAERAAENVGNFFKKPFG